MLMVQRLILLAVVLAGRIGAVIGDDALASVFGHAKADFRMNLMEVVKPGAVVLHLSAVPAKIMIIAFHVGDAVHGAVNRRHGHMGNRGKPCIVKLLAERV